MSNGNMREKTSRHMLYSLCEYGAGGSSHVGNTTEWKLPRLAQRGRREMCMRVACIWGICAGARESQMITCAKKTS